MGTVDIMADENGGNFLTEKKGPLPVWGYGIVLIGVFILFKGLPHLGSAVTASSAVPTVGSSAGGSSSGSASQPITSTTTTPSVLDWLASAQNAANSLGVDPTQFQTAITDYLSNTPIPGAAKTALQAVLNTVCYAPGISLPNYQAPSTQTAPTTPAYDPLNVASNFMGDLQHQLAAEIAAGKTAPGENVFVDVISTGQGALGLTNSGGIYATGNNFNGSPINTYGSLFSVGAGGPNVAVGGGLTYNPSTGGYTVNLANGKSYTFGPVGIVG